MIVDRQNRPIEEILNLINILFRDIDVIAAEFEPDTQLPEFTVDNAEVVQAGIFYSYFTQPAARPIKELISIISGNIRCSVPPR